jgi:hypothetical protein
MSARIVAAMADMDAPNLEACASGLRMGIERARLAGNPGAGDFYDTLGALLDGERDRRAKGGESPDLGPLEARIGALNNGELLTLAMQTTLDAPPGASASAVAFLRAVGGLLNAECGRRAGL